MIPLKGSFTNYVDKILAFFDHLFPNIDIFYGIIVDRNWTFLYHLPTSSCKHSLWTTPKMIFHNRSPSISKYINFYLLHIWLNTLVSLFIYPEIGFNWVHSYLAQNKIVILYWWCIIILIYNNMYYKRCNLLHRNRFLTSRFLIVRFHCVLRLWNVLKICRRDA